MSSLSKFKHWTGTVKWNTGTHTWEWEKQTGYLNLQGRHTSTKGSPQGNSSLLSAISKNFLANIKVLLFVKDLPLFLLLSPFKTVRQICIATRLQVGC